MLALSLVGFRSRDCLYPPSQPASPLFFSALSVNSALRNTRSLTQIDPSAPLLSPRHLPHAAIPFRITSFAHPHHLTPIESYSCKKQGRGWSPYQRFHAAQALPLFSTSSKHPTQRNTHISTLFMRLLNTSHHTRGSGLILDQTLNEAFPCRAILARTGFLRLTGHRPRNTGYVFSARLRELCVSALFFSLLSLSTF